MTYTQVVAGEKNTVLLRSDGVLLAVGINDNAINSTPPPDPTAPYTRVACSRHFAVALRADGTAIAWGTQAAGVVPTLPRGVRYVEIECGRRNFVGRRSDGQVVSSPWYRQTPALPSGQSFVRIAGGWDTFVGLVGSETRYVTTTQGCAGSLPPARLVPNDTPMLGRTMHVRVDRLPHGIALPIFGWNRYPQGVRLDPIGMANCVAYVVPDAVFSLAGTGGAASFPITVPVLPALLGATFHNQAIVLDLAANGAGAVMSEVTEAVIGG
jgi:hypothetical protein